ncbi:hypothetical protein [uncultured Alistipes sp.]|uniref:hypothetical protein n=1 Tax=uncultured Alistipes sp. TaxID=538949 RepID=UPI0032B2A68E
MKIVIRLFGIVLLMLVSCTRDPADTRPRNEAPGALSVEEARRFFEDRAERTFQLTRTGIHPRGFRGLNPGEFTPNWEKALSSQYRKLASIDVPIASDCRFQAVRSRFRNGEAEIFRVDITQKLVVVKDLATDSLGCYILTLIPDPYYAARHKKTDLCEEFLNAGDKGEFSGVAIYTEPTSGILIRVSRYRNGLKTAGVYVPGPPSERKERIRLAKKLIGSVRIGRTVSVSTRSWGEYDWDNDYDNDNDNDNDDDWWEYNGEYTEIGGGWFEDKDGNLYYDSDGDGKPDSMGIDPVEITPDPDPFPDPNIPEEEEEEEEKEEDDERNNGGGGTNTDNTCSQCGKVQCECEKEKGTDIKAVLDLLKQSPVAEKLLSKVSLDKITVKPPKYEGQYGGYVPSTGEIYLCSGVPNSCASMVLLEELMHRYQYNQSDIHGDHSGNIEIEAKLLVWDYLRSQYSENEIRSNFGPAWLDFGKFAENPCEDTWGYASLALFKMGYGDFKCSDYSQFKMNNYESVK